VARLSSLIQQGALKNKHIIVIDDVMTSGHTVNEFAACLKRHGAARVTNLVFARTIAH
jgi:predicted amidophosphoribosyltransferase